MTEKEREQLRQASLKLGGLFAVIGFVLLALAFLPIGEVGLVCFVGGVGILAVGIVFVAKGAEFGEAYVAKQRQESASFMDDESGIVWVWVVALSTWAIMAIAYFALSIPLYAVLDSVEAFAPWAGTTWEDQYLANIALTRNVCAWFLIIMTVGIIGWALINSVRRMSDTYQLPY